MQNQSHLNSTTQQNEIMFVFPPIERFRLLSFCYSGMPLSHMKHDITHVILMMHINQNVRCVS